MNNLRGTLCVILNPLSILPIQDLSDSADKLSEYDIIFQKINLYYQLSAGCVKIRANP
jgi:hypothetical protein